MLESFDLRHLPPGFHDDPYPVYDTLRSASPVHRLPDGSYFLTRYRDLEQVYRDTANFSSDKRIDFRPAFGDGPLYEHHTSSLVFNDPPLHTRVRKKISGALLPRAIADIEPGLVELIDRLLDRIGERGGGDVIADYAAAIPVEVIGNLLGVPHEERAPLRGWSLQILGALEPAPSAQRLAEGNAAVVAFKRYLQQLVEQRRASPGDPAHDMLTRLLAADADGSALDDNELLHNCIFILNAGHETTTNLIGNALQLLMEWPDPLRTLQHRPELIKSAVEEFLRFESSNQLGNRRCLVDAEVGGVSLAAGTYLHLCIGAANRDPAQFPDPHRLDIARQPNRHLAFASGPHQCVGMNLARLEGQVAIGRFVARFPRFRPAGAAVRGGRVRFRGFRSIPVEVDETAAR